MVSLSSFVYRMSLAARTNAARVLKVKTLPALGIRTFSVKSDLGGGGCGENTTDHKVSSPSDFDPSTPYNNSMVEFMREWIRDTRIPRVPEHGVFVYTPKGEDEDVLKEWEKAKGDSNAFVGVKHGKMVKVKLKGDSGISYEVPRAILPSFIRKSDKNEMYRLHMEDPEVYTPERLAKEYGTAVETVDIILTNRDGDNKYERYDVSMHVEMYRLYTKNPEIYTMDKLAKKFGIARGTVHKWLFEFHMIENLLWLKSATSHNQETHRLPLTRSMKEDLAYHSRNLNSFKRLNESLSEVLKKYDETHSHNFSNK